ncbi:MAG: hypothetical protein HY889_10420 [Deltaproteobacteria bacterium]|nr:hypothetical protein [Deltaproteobacteria bacterium]
MASLKDIFSAPLCPPLYFIPSSIFFEGRFMGGFQQVRGLEADYSLFFSGNEQFMGRPGPGCIKFKLPAVKTDGKSRDYAPLGAAWILLYNNRHKDKRV